LAVWKWRRTCGNELAREGAVSVSSAEAATTYSRASSLPQANESFRAVWVTIWGKCGACDCCLSSGCQTSGSWQMPHIKRTPGFIVGASLLANADDQTTSQGLTGRLREQARSHRFCVGMLLSVHTRPLEAFLHRPAGTIRRCFTRPARQSTCAAETAPPHVPPG